MDMQIVRHCIGICTMQCEQLKDLELDVKLRQDIQKSDIPDACHNGGHFCVIQRCDMQRHVLLQGHCALRLEQSD